MCFCRYFVSLSQVRYEHPYQAKERGLCLSLSLYFQMGTDSNKFYAARTSAAGEGWTEPNLDCIESGHRHQEKGYPVGVSLFLMLIPDSNKFKCNSPRMASNRVTKHHYTAYLPPIFLDFPRYTSIFPDSHFRCELYDHRNLFAKQKILLVRIPFLSLAGRPLIL